MRPQARKKAQDVDLSESLFASVLSEDRSPPVSWSVDSTSTDPKGVTESRNGKFL